MKRIIAMMLVLVLVLSLVACGGSDPSKAILGTWKSSSGYSCTFKADGTGNVMVDKGTAVDCKWAYNEETGLYDVDWGYGKASASLVAQDDGTTVLDWQGTNYERVG